MKGRGRGGKEDKRRELECGDEEERRMMNDLGQARGRLVDIVGAGERERRERERRARENKSVRRHD